jgi:hypothetical protein
MYNLGTKTLELIQGSNGDFPGSILPNVIAEVNQLLQVGVNNPRKNISGIQTLPVSIINAKTISRFRSRRF